MFAQIFPQNSWENRTHLKDDDLHLSLPLQQSLPKTRRQKIQKRDFTIYTGARITKSNHKDFLYAA